MQEKSKIVSPRIKMLLAFKSTKDPNSASQIITDTSIKGSVGTLKQMILHSRNEMSKFEGSLNSLKC